LDTAQLIGEIIELQRRVDRTWRQYQLDIWMSLPLTMAQVKCLFFITNQGSTNSGKLAEALKVTPTNITGIIDRLVKHGMVSRTEDSRDRRISVLTATGKGAGLVARLRERKKSHFTDVLACMSTKELTALHRGLSSLVKAIEADEEKGQ
jgi:MarR family transcriptional regulator, organic hydroperoxide resistance regulator